VPWSRGRSFGLRCELRCSVVGNSQLSHWRRVSSKFPINLVSDENETISTVLALLPPHSNYRLHFGCSILDYDWLQRYRVPSDPRRHLFSVSLPAAKPCGSRLFCQGSDSRMIPEFYQLDYPFNRFSDKVLKPLAKYPASWVHTSVQTLSHPLGTAHYLRITTQLQKSQVNT
jgi:hypothetical protein